MIIRRITAENFGKFDRYSVDLSDNINVFYGDNEAGKTTLYEIISILLFAPSNDREMAESNKLIKTKEKYARVYAIINIDGKEISIAREIYANNTNLSIAEQDNVSSLGNVNVPFIGDLTKEMYEAFHTIDYYNMATITNNVWQQIVKVIEDSHGAPRKTPDFSSPEDEAAAKEKSKFEKEIKERESKKKGLETKLKDSQKKQKKMIRNQDKIDDLISELEDVDNNIELESSYLKEAGKMNQIRETIKKTQDLTLELEKYKNLRPWMPNLRQYYERLKLYTKNKEKGIENPLDMFDDLEEREAETKDNKEQASDTKTIEKEEPAELKKEEKSKSDAEEKAAREAVEEAKKQVLKDIKLPSEEDYNLAKEKISRFIEESYLKGSDKIVDKTEEIYKEEKNLPTDSINIAQDVIEDEDIRDNSDEAKPLIIRKPKVEEEDDSVINGFGQSNPYSDNIFPEMDDVKYSEEDISKLSDKITDIYDDDDDDDEDNRYSLSSSNNFPSQTKKVLEKDMNGNENKDDGLLKAEELLNSVDMQEIIAASKEVVEVSDEAKEEIDKVQRRFSIIAKRIFNKDINIDEMSPQLRHMDTNLIYKAIVKYRGLSQKQRKIEYDLQKTENKSSVKGASVGLGIIALFSMLLGLGCFFIDQIIAAFPDVKAVTVIYEVIMELPLNNIVAGNVLSGAAFVLIAILLIVAIILGSDNHVSTEQITVDEVELDELKNNMRTAKREIIDSLKGFPLPSSYLENPNNNIITVINELREAESAYSELLKQSGMPKNESYRTLWDLTQKHLNENELSEDLFDNIAKLRIKIKNYKEIKEKKTKDTKMQMNTGTSAFGAAATTNQFGSLDRTNQTNKNNDAGQNNLFDIPQPQSGGIGMSGLENQGIKTASEESSFKLPQSTDYGTQQNASYPTEGGTFVEAKDISYPANGSALGEVKDTSYPVEGGAFGKAKDTSYPTGGGVFDAAKNPAGGMFGSPDGAQETKEANDISGNNDFGIPGIRRYTDSEPAQQNQSDANNPFAMPKAEKNTNDTPAQSAENTGNDPFGIPGVNRYTNDASTQQAGNAGDNPFDIPGVKRYTDDTPVQSNENTGNISYDIPEVKRHADDIPAQSAENTGNDPFGIPGVNRYTNDTPAQPTENTGENPFGMPGANRYTDDTPIQSNENTENISYDIPEVKRHADDTLTQQAGNAGDDPFGIPGVKRYTNDTPAQPTENTGENPFGIPGANRYTDDTPVQSNENTGNISYDIPEVKRHADDTSTQQAGNAENDPFGIPGVKRYTSDAPAQAEEITENNPYDMPEANRYSDKKPEEVKFGGLPGLDKFSNRGEQASKDFAQSTQEKTDGDIIPPVPPAGGSVSTTSTVAVAAVAGTLSGLPGLDKFSNRVEQINKKPEEEKPLEQENTTAETTEENPFGIPGIHKYTGMEQQSDSTSLNTEKEELPEDTDVIKPDIVDEPEETNEPEAVEAEETEPKAEDNAEEVTEEKEDAVQEEEIKVEVKKDKREKEFEEMLSILGDDPESAIREVEELTRELHAEIIKRDNGMAGLLKLNDAAVRLSTLSSNKWPYKQRAIDASCERIDYLEADRLKLKRHLEMLGSKIEEVPYEDTPQAISDEMKAIEEEIEQLKLESDKHAIAQELIEKQKFLDMSSSADRSHVIEDTSVYMKELTLGKYIKVRINEDQSGLKICDKDEQWFDTTKDRLSQATREQLYLALRISIADLFDEKSLIFPMFFDEALITWDKRRMKAVMRLLSKMSMHRQVIIFTCHDWLKDMISDYLIGAKIILM